MPYYMVKDGQRVGPMSDEEFQNKVLSGEIGPGTLIWQPGMADWIRYDQHAGVPQEPPSQSPVTMISGPAGVCAECGNTFSQEDLVSIAGANLCAGCKPLYLQRMREGARLPNTYNYAGFWIRFVAKFIDNIIIFILNMGVGMVIGSFAAAVVSQPDRAAVPLFLFSTTVGMVINIGFSVFFLGKFGATPGKMALGLRVIRSDGSRITYGRAFGRFFGEMLSGIIFSIGYIMAAFDEEKRALHDHICDTRVVKN